MPVFVVPALAAIAESPLFTSLVPRDDCPEKRSTYEIIWSCISTIFAVTWLAIHPNMPDPDTGWLWRTWLRVLTMFWVVVAPDMVIYCALNQWVAAREIARMYKDNGWTVTHGFFLQMGGFRLVRPDGTTYPLWVDRFEELLKAGQIDFPSIAKDEIDDKSKGDVLAKGVAVLQTTWFILQCIVRGAKHLDITTLEIFTVGYAALNGVMYYLWWNKPLDVERAYMVPLKTASARGLESENLEKIVQFPVADHTDLQASLRGHSYLGSPAATSGADQPPAMITHSHPGSPSVSPSPRQSYFRIWGNKVYAFFSIIIRIIVNPYFWMATDHNMSEEKKCVGTFYAYDAGRNASKFGIMFLVTCVYGAIHLVAWSFTFPSLVEKILWHTSSLVLVVVPFYFSVVFYFVGSYYDKPWIFRVAKFSGAFGLLTYVFARLILMILALTGLRNLSANAYLMVDWIGYLPHLGSSQ